MTQQLINWPQRSRKYAHLHTTGEGGIWTYLYYPVRDDIPPTDAGLPFVTDPDATAVTRWPDPLVKCHGPEATLTLPLPDVVLRDDGMLYPGDEDLPAAVGPDSKDAVAREHYLTSFYDCGSAILGAVLLGSHPHAWADEQGTYWTPTRGDLSRAGRRFVHRLDAYYDRLGWLVTYLDT